MDPTRGPDHLDLSTGRETRDFSDGPRQLVKAFNHLGELSRAVGDPTVGVFGLSSPNSNTT